MINIFISLLYLFNILQIFDFKINACNSITQKKINIFPDMMIETSTNFRLALFEKK